MIQINDLSFRYSGSQSASLQNINLTIGKGDFILLTGESGCGKTTLTRVLNGLCPQFFEGELTGQYLLNGKNAFDMTLDEIGMKIGNVFQDPRSQFFSTNTTDEIVMAMENRNYPVATMRERLDEVQNLLHLDGLLDRSIFNLSSGEKQKIAIASACAIHPSVVVLDEPSANLDAESTRHLAKFLEILKAQGMTIIVSEHRLYYLAHLIDKMVFMENGYIHSIYSSAEARAIPSDKMIQMGLRLFDIPPKRIGQSQSDEAPFINVSKLSFSRYKKSILRHLSFCLSIGEIVAITGNNGVGKSTFCKILSGILSETGGDISVNNKRAGRKMRLTNSFFVGQDADYQLYASTVLEEVTLNLKTSEALTSSAKEILKQLDLSEYENRHPVSLSGGQKQRVLLAAALLRKRPILILDEPTSGLDGRHMRITAEILRKITKQGVSIMLITHDMEFLQLVADRVVCMQNGLLKDSIEGYFTTSVLK
ncbi:MAG: ABC transporter ATP-binding protein [Suipraeoptans sp.]